MLYPFLIQICFRPAIVPSPIQSESETESAATLTSDPHNTSGEGVKSKSWADMVENEDSDLNEYPELSGDDSDKEARGDKDDEEEQGLVKPPQIEEDFD